MHMHIVNLLTMVLNYHSYKLAHLKDTAVFNAMVYVLATSMLYMR